MAPEADFWCSRLWRCCDEVSNRKGRRAWNDLRGGRPHSCADLTAVFPAHGTACHPRYIFLFHCLSQSNPPNRDLDPFVINRQEQAISKCQSNSHCNVPSHCSDLLLHAMFRKKKFMHPPANLRLTGAHIKCGSVSSSSI